MIEIHFTSDYHWFFLLMVKLSVVIVFSHFHLSNVIEVDLIVFALIGLRGTNNKYI